MLLAFILFLFAGILAGVVTGLIPGIHINLVGVFLISMSIFAKINPVLSSTFIISMAITHTFLDFVPSIFLGCPDTDTELSILPGHELLKSGKAYEGILLTAYGSFAAILILLVISFPSIILIKKSYSIIKELIPFILIFISIVLIYLQKNKLQAFFVFVITGILGFLVLNTQTNQSLLPLLTGLFGASSLIISIKNKTKIPKQEITKPKIKLFKPLLGATIAAPFCSFLPGLGSGQAAIIGNTISKSNQKDFLILLGATNTLVMGFSFLSLYTIQKTRTGAALAIKEILLNFTPKILIVLLIIILISGTISFFLTKKLAKIFSQNFHKINYNKISIATLIILIILNLLISGPIGFLILTISTLTGIYCIQTGSKRTNMMGCLLIPTIILYLF